MPTLPRLHLPFDLPVDVPKMSVPDVDLPDAERVLAVLRDAGTGLVSLVAERVAGAPATLVEAVTAQVARVTATVKAAVPR